MVKHLKIIALFALSLFANGFIAPSLVVAQTLEYTTIRYATDQVATTDGVTTDLTIADVQTSKAAQVRTSQVPTASPVAAGFSLTGRLPGGTITTPVAIPTIPVNPSVQPVSLNLASANPALGATVSTDLAEIVLNLNAQMLVGTQTATLYVMHTGATTYTFVKTLATQAADNQVVISLGGGLAYGSSYKITITGNVAVARKALSTMSRSPSSGITSSPYSYDFTFATKSSPVNAQCAPAVGQCTIGTPTTVQHITTTSTWVCNGLPGGTNASCALGDTGFAGTKLGININGMSDWGNRDLTFVDAVKSSRGFANVTGQWWDPWANPAPLGADGWPTADFADIILSNDADPLGRSLQQTFPSMFGTYHVSFTGRGHVVPLGCCTAQNEVYDALSNTTTAEVTVGPNDTMFTISVTQTTNGVKNFKVIRPGYAANTTQLFTNQFLNMLQPFSTIRFMDFLATNGNPVTNWAGRKKVTDPIQTDGRGTAWEYVIALANASGKDIWINIPDQVDLTDTSSNNYVTQLAQMLKANLNPNIHVYVEYSNEVWNTIFAQTAHNANAAIAEVNSNTDPTLNYDNSNNSTYWSYRRNAHQVLRISNLFRAVYGDAAINTTIRPVLSGFWVMPFISEDALAYINANFGAPSHYIYAIAGAPYMDVSTNYTDVNSFFTNMTVGLNNVLSQQIGVSPYNGIPGQWTGVTMKNLADYYHVKSVTYEGGPGPYTSDPTVEAAFQDTRTEQLVEGQLADFFGCGNDLFMFYQSSASAGLTWGAYLDPTVPTQKSTALLKVANTPLSHYTVCSTTYVPSLLNQ